MTTMSHSRDRRLDRIDRAREWDKAMIHIDRMIEWALATGRVELMAAAGIRLQLLAVMPTRSEFATGRWAPTPASPEDIEAGREFFREVETWHTNQRQANEQGA